MGVDFRIENAVRSMARLPSGDRMTWRLALVAAMILTVAVFAIQSLRWRADARFWECNADRWQARAHNWRQAYNIYRGDEIIDTGHFGSQDLRPDVTVVLRDPRPYDGCWLDSEHYQTEGVKPRTVVR